MASRLLEQWLLQTRAQAAAQAAVLAATQAVIEAAWRQMANPFDPIEERSFAEVAARAIGRGRTQANDLASANVRRVLADAGVKPSRRHAIATPEPRGIPLADEAARAVKQYRFEISEGKADDVANRGGLTRAQIIAATDLAMAARDGFSQAIADVPAITGYRRVVHPELSTGGTCGLCIAAATRIYKSDELMPLHDRCNCTQLPILRGVEDIAQRINDQDLLELYKQIGLTRRDDLARVRVQVEQHGELGPVLVHEGHRFRNLAHVEADADGGTPIGDLQAPPTAA